jgi:hypothetical protein
MSTIPFFESHRYLSNQNKEMILLIGFSKATLELPFNSNNIIFIDAVTLLIFMKMEILLGSTAWIFVYSPSEF